MPRANNLAGWAHAALRLGVGGLFLYAGAQKLLAPSTFAEQIANYQFWPDWAPWGAAVLPAVEIVTALALVLGPRPWRVGAAAAIFGMLILFTAALGRAWMLGINVDCGCFGQGSSHIGPWPVARNLGLLLALALCARGDRWGAPSSAQGADAAERRTI